MTRVEGHGNINVSIRNGAVEKCEWSIPEAPRFFEAMVVGRSMERTAPHYLANMRYLLNRSHTCFVESHGSGHGNTDK